ncbi:MAG: SIS domain-containing protein [Dehalococcoidia bacterium]|nr:SIS domain-containing protein [Dehalococcoidia bacterium]
MRSKKAVVAEQVRESTSLCANLAGQADTIVQIAEQMTKAFRQGKKVLLFGNGGSAADAEHIACELAGKFTLFRDPLPAIALTANTSSLTAIGNDFGYEEVFARQLRGLVAKGDVVIGLSTSGASANVISAIEEANRRGAITMAFTGAKGKLKDSAQHVLSIPSTDTPRIQEAHMLAGHIICGLVEESLFGKAESAHSKGARS